MVVNTRKIVSLMMLSGWLLFAPAVLANGGAAAAAVAVMNSSNNSTRTEAILPQKSQIFDYRSNGEKPLETRIETFPPEKWRQLGGSQGGFFICPGKDSEYRTYLGNKRCRIPDIGVNGFLGGMKDHQELPLDEYLAITTGKSVDVQTVELTKNYLKVKFGLYPVGGAGQNPTSSVLINNGPEIAEAAKSGLEAGLASLDEGVMTADAVRQELNQDAKKDDDAPTEQITNSVGKTNPFDPSGDALQLLSDLTDSALVKGMAAIAIFIGLVQGIVRQSISALFINVAAGMMILNAPSIMQTILVPATTTVDTQDDIGFSSIALALLPMVLIFSIWFFYKKHRERQELEMLMSLAGANGNAHRSAGDSDLPNLNELREQTQEQTEPVVLNQSTAAPKVQPVEPEIEITKNKRKVILD
ncbi:hypothetical protein [Vibrio parahaemolyticus]|uniref:hypothetical protein n=1 Tax=Vibrio parahaemolyticus TaxID=670 RepID=UPI0025549C31|nr:hypothetical protein [Vibrio parahaemolyticus]